MTENIGACFSILAGIIIIYWIECGCAKDFVANIRTKEAQIS